MSKQKKLDKILSEIDANWAVLNDLGHKLIAFGGSKANRTAMLDQYARAVREDERLQAKRSHILQPWWNRIGSDVA